MTPNTAEQDFDDFLRKLRLLMTESRIASIAWECHDDSDPSGYPDEGMIAYHATGAVRRICNDDTIGIHDLPDTP